MLELFLPIPPIAAKNRDAVFYCFVLEADDDIEGLDWPDRSDDRQLRIGALFSI